ncbi:MAG: decaprenyl-phosphate phosphoribosyltransferase [Lentisphaerae bacterium]|nr:decaprenyl-phosphate phosphoribosyltransferase [Lentisphaerota bacterium]
MGTRPADMLAALRPSQWTKNAVVPAAFVFALGDRGQPVGPVDGLRVAAATLLFCLVSSAVYLFNDIRDLEADRLHPLKKHRPLAAGRVGVGAAGLVSALLAAGSLGGAWLVAPRFAGVMSAYVLIQLVYSLALKRVALVDIMVIAAGFVLRAVAGAVVVEATISPWLLLCAFLLAVFLALCKRRHEKLLLEDAAGGHRPSLDKYDRSLLDQLIGVAASSTIVAYAIYTLAPGTVAKFGTSALGLTIPFVMFGVFRYLDLVYRHEGGDRPERILLSDVPILVNLALYGIAVALIFALAR